jgi:hypothetical protein
MASSPISTQAFHGSDEQTIGAIQQIPHAGSGDQYVTGSAAEFLRPPPELKGESPMELLIALPSILLFFLAEVARHRREQREQEEAAANLIRPVIS